MDSPKTQTMVAQAANVAWHIRVNGMDQVTPEHIKLMAEVLDQLLKREGAVQLLLSKLAEMEMCPSIEETADLIRNHSV